MDLIELIKTGTKENLIIAGRLLNAPEEYFIEVEDECYSTELTREYLEGVSLSSYYKYTYKLVKYITNYKEYKETYYFIKFISLKNNNNESINSRCYFKFIYI